MTSKAKAAENRGQQVQAVFEALWEGGEERRVYEAAQGLSREIWHGSIADPRRVSRVRPVTQLLWEEALRAPVRASVALLRAGAQGVVEREGRPVFSTVRAAIEARRADVLKVLLWMEHAPVDDPADGSPLARACEQWKGDELLAVLSTLVSGGASAVRRNALSKTPADVARRLGQQPAAEFLNEAARRQRGFLRVQKAAYGGEPGEVSEALASYDGDWSEIMPGADGKTATHAPAAILLWETVLNKGKRGRAAGDMELVGALREAGVPVEVTRSNRRLYSAVARALLNRRLGSEWERADAAFELWKASSVFSPAWGDLPLRSLVTSALSDERLIQNWWPVLLEKGVDGRTPIYGETQGAKQGPLLMDFLQDHPRRAKSAEFMAIHTRQRALEESGAVAESGVGAPQSPSL